MAQVNHLPIVVHFARRLGLVELVNELVPTQMAVEPGMIAWGLMLDTLCGRSPLYHLQTAFDECDQALLFGQELPAEYFSDDDVGRMLDCFFAAGTQRVFSALSVRALESFAVSTQQVPSTRPRSTFVATISARKRKRRRARSRRATARTSARI